MNFLITHGATYDPLSREKLNELLRCFAAIKSNDAEFATKYGIGFQSENIIMRPHCYCESENCPYCWDFEESGIPPQDMMQETGIEAEMPAPNFWYKPLDFKVWWDKRIGRQMIVNKRLTEREFLFMKNDCFSLSSLFKMQKELKEILSILREKTTI